MSTECSLGKITKKLKESINQIPPIKFVDGSWARSNKQKIIR